MPKTLSFKTLSKDFIYRCGLEVIYKERHLPTTLAVFFCSVEYQKVEGKGFVISSKKTCCYNFDYNSGNLTYASYHDGDFTKPGFGWADTRTEQFEHDKIGEEHREHAKKVAEWVYEQLKQEKAKSTDKNWQEKREPFLSPLEIITKKDD